MAIQHFSEVVEAQGPVNTGPGSQNNLILHMHDAPRGGGALTVAAEHRRYLGDRFVEPPSFGRAAERLVPEGGVVLLDGQPGEGRRAAAIMLLQQVPVRGRFEELLVTDWEDALGDATTDDRFILDLSNNDDEEFGASQRSLAACRAAIEARRARAVVILPAGCEHLVDPELRSLIVGLRRPYETAVLQRCLKADQVPCTSGDLSMPGLQRLLDRLPMRDIARLSALALRAKQSRRFGDEPSAWIQQAVEAVTNGSAEVGAYVERHKDPIDRSLMLTASLVSGAGPDAHFHVAHALRTTLRIPEDNTPRLLQSGLSARLAALDMAYDANGGVVFGKFAFDVAVREYFWRDFPDLRSDWRDWVEHSARLPQLTREDRANLVVRYAERALATGCHAHLLHLALRWTSGKGPVLRTEAVTALRLGLADERHGAYFRDQIYAAAKGQRLAPEHCRALVEVCRTDLAASHPEQALVRLHLLALRAGGDETAEARTALLDLVRRERHLYRRLVRRAQRLSREGRERNLAILRRLVDPENIPADMPQDDVRLVWQTVLAQRDDAYWAPSVRSWLSAVRTGVLPEDALAVPLSAAENPGVANRLYLIVRDWLEAGGDSAEPAAPARRIVAVRSWQELDLAQGIDPIEPAFLAHT